MFPILQIGPLAVSLPGLALLIGVWSARWLAEKEAARLRLKPAAVYNLSFIGLAVGLIRAPLVHVVRYWSAYVSDPLSIFSLNATTLAPLEGALVGVVASLIYAARRKLPLRLTPDALAPAVAGMGVAVALAHRASGDAFGAPARWPWSVYLWDEYRHSSQIYELIAALAVLGSMWRQRLRTAFAGFNFPLVVELSAATRIFLEAFRGDSLLVMGGVRAVQVWGLVVLIGYLPAMKYWKPEAAL